MLTQDQKSKLKSLTCHEKYGKLLIEAMKTWETTHPKQRAFGVVRGKDEKWEVNYGEWETNYEVGCCLIGAAIVGKKSVYDTALEVAIAEFFLFDKKDTWVLSDGFDGHSNDESEAWFFGKNVSDILFMKEG